MTPAAGTGPETGERRRRLAACLSEREQPLQGLLVSGRANVRYLSGFSGSSGWILLVRDERPVLLTDGRYREQAEAEAAGFRIEICSDGLASGLAALADRDLRLGFESEHLSHAAAAELTERAATPQWLPVRKLVEELRARKSAVEVDAIRAALRLCEEVLTEVAAWVTPGLSEADLAAEIDYRCRQRGARRMAFETIVAAGAHGALPHARPASAPIPAATPVVVDMGCELHGYCSDITRCLVLGGHPGPAWMRVHEAVSRAREAGIGAIAAGVAAAAVDASAREVLREAGLGEAFVHGLGHGVGLEIHEAPRLAERSDETLAAGMVVTVEPGVYLPGEGGIRLEDLVVVTEGGAERLNELDDSLLFAGC